MRLQHRIVLAYSILITIALLALGFVLCNRLTDEFMLDLEQSLAHKAALLTTHSLEEVPLLQKQLFSLAQDMDTRFTIINTAGEVILESSTNPEEMDNHRNRPEFITALKGDRGQATRFSNTMGQNFLYVTVPLFDEQGNILGAVRTSRSLSSIQERIDTIRQIIITAALLLLPILWLLGYFTLKAVTRSLGQLIQRARSIGRGEFQHSLPPHSRDEVGELEMVFNEMSFNVQEMMGALEEEKERSIDIIKKLPVGILVMNRQGTIQASNPLFFSLLNLPEPQKPLTQLLQLIHDSQFIEFVKGLWTEEVTLQKTELSLGDPPKHLLLTASPLGPQGQDRVLVLQDITTIRNLEEMRKTFVANVSHELQTPLTAISGFAETLLEGALSDTEVQQKFLQTIYQEAQRLSRLIEDLLTLSRLESSSQGHSGEANLARCTDKALNLLMGLCEKNNMDLEVDIQSDLEVNMGENELVQVILNLISNAIQYSPPQSSIHISAGKKGDMAYLAITDTGVGIPYADQPFIFQRFYRVDKGRSRESGGTGLGLSIVKHSLERAGGRVEMESTPGEGSTFTIYIPSPAPSP